MEDPKIYFCHSDPDHDHMPIYNPDIDQAVFYEFTNLSYNKTIITRDTSFNTKSAEFLT